jgi:uncharacterized repeat protein (TIGR02543 family)
VAPEGYEFLGWYDAPQSVGGNRITEIPKGSTGEITLYAHWKEVVYDVTYKLYQTPLGAISEEKYLHYTVSKGLKDLPNPEIYNYIFLGWYTDNGAEVKEISKIPSKEELVARALYGLNAPISGLAIVLNAIVEKQQQSA